MFRMKNVCAVQAALLSKQKRFYLCYIYLLKEDKTTTSASDYRTIRNSLVFDLILNARFYSGNKTCLDPSFYTQLIWSAL